MEEKQGFITVHTEFLKIYRIHIKGNKAGNTDIIIVLKILLRGIFWMIPFSSRIDKFRKRIKKKE